MEELNLKKIQVRNNAIITTAEKYFTEEELKELDGKITLEHDKATGILFKDTAHAKNLPKLVQQVVNIGPMVRDIKVGDWVFLNPLHYLNRHLINQRNSIQQDIADANGNSLKEEFNEMDYDFPVIKLDGVEHLMLFDRDVEYIILEANEGSREYKSNRNDE
jgi:hypothetical protein